MKYILKLKFLGTNFSGYQVQPGKRTVQSVIQDALERLFDKRYEIKGCSRTDSGVHANVFYVTFDLPENASSITPNKMPYAFNSVLPDDISVLDAALVDDDFHVRHNVHFKEYVYIIDNSLIRDPFTHSRVYHYPKLLTDDKINQMNLAAEIICGKHDFSCFMSSGSSVTDTVRDIKYLDVTKNGNEIIIRIAADGFLYNMVRIISGTLLDVAKGKVTVENIKEMLKSGDRSKAGPTLPACGLYLNYVKFDRTIFNEERK